MKDIGKQTAENSVENATVNTASQTVSRTVGGGLGGVGDSGGSGFMKYGFGHDSTTILQ